MSMVPTLHAAITGTLEFAINRALQLDPAGRRDLLQLLAEPACLVVTEPVQLTLCLQATAGSVRVSATDITDAALTFRGSPLAMAALALGDESALQDGRLTIEGDTAHAQQFQKALTQLNPDWEAALARYTGDITAHLAGQRLRAAVRWSRTTVRSVTDSVEEYIHEEARLLPGRRELETLRREIDGLALRSDRLEASIHRLKGLTDRFSARPEPAPGDPS